MGIKIKKLTGEVFDLPPEFVIEGEKNNPLFSNKGSQTVSITFPKTTRNRQLLEYAHRLDKNEKPSQTMPVVVESGPSQQRGLMAINSGTSANIGFDEAEMYNQMSEMQLKDLSDLPSLTLAGNTREQRVTSMLKHLTSVMKAEIETDYYIFPVVLKFDLDESSGKKYRVILNELNLSLMDSNNNPTLPYGALADLSALNHRLLTWYMDNEEVYIDAMEGYGVSPFLKVFRILELIFSHYGFNVTENPFREHRQLKKLVVLNNVMDAILTGTLYYKDMMPDLTVKEFFEGLYNKFGMLYFINSNTKTVKIKLLKDILHPDTAGTLDGNLLKTNEPEISYSPQRQLKLTMNRELESGEGYPAQVLYNTFEEFLKAYNNQFTDWNSEEGWITGLSSAFDTQMSTYLIKDVTDDENLMSSDFFDWDKKTPDLAYEEIKMEDVCLPFDFIPNIILLHYGADFKHHYSNVSIDGETAQEDENPAKLAFAFGWGLTDYTEFNRYNWFFASQINRDVHGHFMNDANGDKYDISLTCNREDGLYNRFWKEYDAFIRHSNQEVACKLKLSDTAVFNFEMYKTVFINHQPLLPEQVKFKLNKKDGINECTFRTLRLYEPYDLPKEQGIPVYDRQKYYWKATVVDIPDLSYPPWTKSSPFGYKFVTIDGVNYDTKMLFVLPPTEDQFLNQELITLTYKSEATRSSYLPVEVTTTVTYTPTEIIYI
jgi:hypothetical protein